LASNGRVVYAWSTGASGGDISDVFEHNLDTGRTTMLVSHKSLPRSFTAPINSIAISPSGRYVAVVHYVDGCCCTIGNRKGGCWILDRQTGRIRILFREPDEFIRTAIWTPSGKNLLLLGNDDYLYSVRSGRMHELPFHLDSTDDHYCLTDSGAVDNWGGTSESSTMCLRLFSNGREVTLFNWPKRIDSIERSPAGSAYVFSDMDGVYYRSGKTTRNLGIHWPPICSESRRFVVDHFDTDLMFNDSGSRLAALVVAGGYDFRTAVRKLEQDLWLAHTSRSVATRLSAWRQTEKDNVPYVERSLAGWTSDGTRIIVKERTDDWAMSRLVSYRTDSPGSNGNALFHAGDRCLAMSWWPGPRSGR
jgi:hypothetical protein